MRQRRAAAAFGVALALLAPVAPACAAGEDELVGLINDYRGAPRTCEGRTEAMAGPLSPSRELASVDVGSSENLGDALLASGYRAASATTILFAGSGSAAEVMRFVAGRYCRSLLDPRYSQIGVARSRSAWRINLARPLLPDDLGDWRDAGKTVLRLVNEARSRSRDCGDQHFAAAPPLRWNEALADAALAHSLDMAARNYFSHTDPAGNSVAQRAVRAGYRWRHVGENIAAGLGEPAKVVAGWLASPGHCANIMAPDFAEMGAAYAINPGSDLDVYGVSASGARAAARRGSAGRRRR
jgi:uncharacterized protein YkwD